MITISNNPAISSQYSNLPTAINDTSAGDIILVAGSSTYYGDISINKQLVLYGAGYNNPYGANTLVDDITLRTQNASIGASGTKISGIYVRYNFYIYGNYIGGGKMGNVVIESCKLQVGG